MLFELLDKIHLLAVSDYESILFSTMFLFAFFFGLRIGEYTTSPHNLQFSDITVSKTEVIVMFQSFKHSNSNRRTLPHSMKPTSSRYCPVVSENNYLKRRPRGPGPIFISLGKPISPKTFTLKFKQLVRLTGRSPEHYSAHSFRIGAATHWFNQNISESRIRQLGRWSSNAFSSYIGGSIDHSI